MKLRFLIFFFSLNSILFSQEKTFISQDIAINNLIDGTLLAPKNITKPNLVIIIAGSGPTDKNGNQNFLKNNTLKKLAVGLTENNIATFRYDKRIVKQIRKGNVDKNIMFDDFVTDAISVINFFKNKNEFNKIYVAGHSQGSLVGMLAAKKIADGFISLAGAGQSIDNVIIEQIEATAPMFTEDAKRIFNILSQGKTTNNYPVALASIFNKNIQAFMTNWMQYKPTEEIKKLNIPVLIINGTKDLQVSINEAKLLKEAALNATLKIIENMNHVLVIIEGDTLENSKSYNEPLRQISPVVFNSIINFIENK